MDSEQLTQILEALIFASDTPLTLKQMQQALEEVEEDVLTNVVNGLVQAYNQGQHAFMITRVAGGYQFTTRPEFARWIKKLYDGRVQTRLSRAALEALAIVAFKQPVSRTEVAAIRGVNSDGVMKSLLERNLITISGRAPDQGRPLLYRTSDHFLQYFGINDLTELPKPREIEELLAEGEATVILADLEKKQELENLKRNRQQPDGMRDNLPYPGMENMVIAHDAIE